MMNLLTIAGILLIFYLPGYCISRLFQLKLKDFELVFFEIATSILLSGLIAFILAHTALFSLTRLYTILAAVCIITFLIRKPSFGFAPRKLFFIACFAAIAASLIFLKPQEAFHGGLDPGVYISTGINIANTGAILTSSKIIEEIYRSNITGFYTFKDPPVMGNYGNELPGFYMTDPENGIITPQFYHMYPVWIAIFYLLFGLKGTLFVAPLFSLLSLAAMFFFLKKILGTNIAILATALLAINFAQAWYTLTANSEVMMQFYFFLTLYLLYLFTESKITAAGPLAALAAACGMLTRVEFAVIIPVIVGYLTYIHLTQKNTQMRYFFIPFIFLFAYCILAVATLSRHYASFLVKTLFLVKVDLLHFSQLPVQYWPLIVGGLLLFLLIKFIVNKRIDTSPRQKLIISLIIWLLVALFSVLSHKILPNITVNLTTLFWYITPIGFFMGFLGLLIMPWNKNKNVGLLIITCSLFLSLYAIKSAITPVHPWWVRRFLPVILPALIIGISYFILKNKIFMRTLPKKIFAALLILIIAVPFAAMTAKIFTSDEFEGLAEILSELDQNISEPALIVFLNEGDSHKYATPLRYIFGRDVLPLTELNNQSTAYLSALANEKNIYVILPPEKIKNALSTQFSLKPVYYRTAVWKGMSRQKEWKPRYHKLVYLPDEIYELRHDVALYQIEPSK